MIANYTRMWYLVKRNLIEVQAFKWEILFRDGSFNLQTTALKALVLLFNYLMSFFLFTGWLLVHQRPILRTSNAVWKTEVQCIDATSQTIIAARLFTSIRMVSLFPNTHTMSTYNFLLTALHNSLLIKRSPIPLTHILIYITRRCEKGKKINLFISHTSWASIEPWLIFMLHRYCYFMPTSIAHKSRRLSLYCLAVRI